MSEYRILLEQNLRKYGMRIAKEVPHDGDCWYHSMTHSGFSKNPQQLRSGIAYLFELFADVKGIFPNQPESSLRTMFDIFDKQYVYDHDKFCMVPYSFETMCRDMRIVGSWMNLPMHLIILFASLLFDLEFLVYTSIPSRPITRVVWDETVGKKYSNQILLGQVGDIHYVPVEKYVEPVAKFPSYHSQYSFFSDSDNDDELYRRSRYFSKLNPNYRHHGGSHSPQGIQDIQRFSPQQIALHSLKGTNSNTSANLNEAVPDNKTKITTEKEAVEQQRRKDILRVNFEPIDTQDIIISGDTLLEELEVSARAELQKKAFVDLTHSSDDEGLQVSAVQSDAEDCYNANDIQHLGDRRIQGLMDSDNEYTPPSHWTHHQRLVSPTEEKSFFDNVNSDSDDGI
jgi:hypothetical protein